MEGKPLLPSSTFPPYCALAPPAASSIARCILSIMLTILLFAEEVAALVIDNG